MMILSLFLQNVHKMHETNENQHILLIRIGDSRACILFYTIRISVLRKIPLIYFCVKKKLIPVVAQNDLTYTNMTNYNY